MDELLQIVADQKGYPAEMVERSAAARAKADGVSVEDVLRAWAGEGAAPVAAAAPAAPTPAAAGEPPATPEASEPVDDGGPKVEVLAPEAEPPAGAAEEAVAEDVEPEAEEEEEIAATSGSGFPRWLAAAFVVLPSLALLYVLVLPSGPQCGNAGALAVDPATGVAVNCDGSEFGSDGNDVFAVGDALYSAQCASCHGANGGGGTGPAFTNGAVLTTFSSCADHIEWVLIGTAAWPDATYGDNAKPVGGGGQMPGFDGLLTEAEIAAVSLYERVAFGGEDRAEAEAACIADGEVTASGP